VRAYFTHSSKARAALKKIGPPFAPSRLALRRRSVIESRFQASGPPARLVRRVRTTAACSDDRRIRRKLATASRDTKCRRDRPLPLANQYRWARQETGQARMPNGPVNDKSNDGMPPEKRTRTSQTPEPPKPRPPTWEPARIPRDPEPPKPPDGSPRTMYEDRQLHASPRRFVRRMADHVALAAVLFRVAAVGMWATSTTNTCLGATRS